MAFRIPPRLKNDPTATALFCYVREHKLEPAGYDILADYCEERGWVFDALKYRLAARIIAQPRVRLVGIMAQHLGLDPIPDHEAFALARPMTRTKFPIRDAELLAWLIRDWCRATQGKEFP